MQNNKVQPEDNPNYTNLAIQIARDLSNVIREKNRLPISPKSGADLYEMPVYEQINQQRPCNLYTHTSKEVIQTTLQVVYEEPKFVDAFFRKYTDENGKQMAKIIVTDQNPCWTRFLATKEIMHCHINETGDETKTHSDLKNLIIAIINDTGNAAESQQSNADYGAYFGAVEYLIPSDTIPLLNAVLQTLKQNAETAQEAYLILAKRIRVPESILEYRLNNDEIFNIDAHKA